MKKIISIIALMFILTGVFAKEYANKYTVIEYREGETATTTYEFNIDDYYPNFPNEEHFWFCVNGKPPLDLYKFSELRVTVKTSVLDDTCIVRFGKVEEE